MIAKNRTRKTMSNVILVFPKMLIDQRLEQRTVPLSVHTLATYIVEKEGYNVKIIDQRIDNDWRMILDEEFKKNPRDVK